MQLSDNSARVKIATQRRNYDKNPPLMDSKLNNNPKGSGSRAIVSKPVVVHSIKSDKTQTSQQACSSKCSCARCRLAKKIWTKNAQSKTGKKTCAAVPAQKATPSAAPLKVEKPTPAPVAGKKDAPQGFQEYPKSNAGSKNVKEEAISAATAGSHQVPTVKLGNPEWDGTYHYRDVSMHAYALMGARSVPPPPPILDVPDQDPPRIPGAPPPVNPARGPLKHPERKFEPLDRTALLIATVNHLPSWDRLSEEIPTKRGARKARQSKGGRSGKKNELVQKSEAESRSMESGISDAAFATRQAVIAMFLDALSYVDSKHVTDETRAEGIALLAKYSVSRISDVTEAVIESVLKGSPPPVPADDPPEEPKGPPACTSIMRDPTAVVDPWKITMTVKPPPPISVAVRACSSLASRIFPTLRISPWVMDFFCPRVGDALKGTALDSLITVSLMKWPVTRMLKMLTSIVTASHVESASNFMSYLGPVGWANAQIVGHGIRAFSTLFPLITASMAVASTLKLGYEIYRGDHSKIVRYTVRPLPADELCLSSACNEHRDVRSLSAGKVDRSKCGCFSKVSVRVYKSTFGVLTFSESEHYISDEVFASLSAMNMLRPGLSLADNIKRLRNTTGLSDYVNLNRGDKARNLASTFWLAEVKLISEWVEHNSLTKDLLPQLE